MIKRLEWKNCLETSKKMINAAKLRNAALDFSEKKEAEYSTIKRKCENAIADIRRHHDELKIVKLPVAAENYIKVINEYLVEVKAQYSKFLDIYGKAVQMCNKVETYKEYLEMYTSIYKDLKLTKEEYTDEDLPAIIALILLANREDLKIKEADFFEDLDDFYARIKKNPKLVGLLSFSDDIISTNTIDDYLQDII